MQINIHKVLGIDYEHRTIAEPGESDYEQGLRVTRLYLRTADGCDITVVSFGLTNEVPPPVTLL